MKYTLDSMLPERAFQKKIGGYAPATLEGGGSSAPSSAPTTSTVTNTNIPDYAQPYVENMLGATQQQLFNTSTNEDGSTQITGIKPYTPYGLNQSTGQAYSPQELAGNMQVAQNAIAGFSPLQQQAQQNIANMQMPGQYGQGSNMAAMSGMGALGTTRGAGMYGAMGAQQGLGFGQQAQDPNAVQGYMNPYLQASLDPQLAEIQRQYDITGTQEMSNAANSGAFGGSREALMAAENQRNKNIAMNQAIGQGYNNAFQNAQQQMSTAAQLGMQGAGIGLQGIGAQQAGYGQAGQAGANLANIGGQALQAQQGIYGLQNQTGAQQQAQQQNVINQAVQNYAVAQQYPQQQLAFMNAQLRGLPMQASTTQQYLAQPSAVSQAAGLGTAGIAGLGLYNAMSGTGKKAGGAIKSYAEGGIADIDRKVLLAPDKYSVQQIQNGMHNGVINKLVGDPVLADKIKEHQMANAPQPQQQQPTIDQQINQQAMQLAQSAPPPLPMQQAQGLPAAQSNLPTFNAYDGGIVAFAGGGATSPAGTLFSDLSPKEQLDKLRQIEEQKIRAEKLNPPKAPVVLNSSNTPSFLLNAAAPQGAQQVYATGQNITPPTPVTPTTTTTSPSFGERFSSGIDSLKNMFSSGEKTPSSTQTGPRMVQGSDVKNMISSNSRFRGPGIASDANVYPGVSDLNYLNELKAASAKDPSYQPYKDEIAALLKRNPDLVKQQLSAKGWGDEERGDPTKALPDNTYKPPLNDMQVIRDPNKNVNSNNPVAPKAPAVKEEAAPVSTESSGLDWFNEQANGLKSSQDDLKKLILGQGENSDKQLKINSLLALANAGFGMAGGTSPNAITNIAAGGAKGIEGLSQAFGQNEAAKARQIQQLVSLGLKGQELNAELQKLGITKDYYDMHAPLFAAQSKQALANADYLKARALNPPGSGRSSSAGLLQPGRISATEQLKIDERYNPANFLADKAFIASLDPTIQAQLNTKPGSPSYNAGMANVNKIVEDKKNRFEAGIRKSNATYKVPSATFLSSED